MRSMASGAAFHCAFAHATQQALLEAHELAFHFFHGVFRKLRYDNLTAALKKIFQGYRREETARFIAFREYQIRVHPPYAYVSREHRSPVLSVFVILDYS